MFCTECGQPARPPTSRERGVRSLARRTAIGRRSLITGAAVLALAGVAAAVIVVMAHPSGVRRPGTGIASAGTAAPTPALGTAAGPAGPSSPSTAAASERQAAANLAALLAQSGSDRQAVTAAFNDVGQCGPNLSQDAQAFQEAAASHRQLMGELTAMPGLRSLPQPMVSDLAGAWQSSAGADTNFAQWAQDQVTNGCSPDDQTDPSYVMANKFDVTATASKTAFVTLWNSLAQAYGLRAYSQSDL
jgi:hypothetical protein